MVWWRSVAALLLLVLHGDALYLPWNPEYTIGAGINSATLETKSSRCIRNLRVVEDPPHRVGQKIIFQFQGVEDTGSLRSELSFAITGAKGEPSFQQSFQSAMVLSSYEAAFVLRMTIESGGSLRLDEDEAEWVQALNKREGTRLLELCGDSFIERVETGGVLYAVIKTSRSVYSKSHTSRTFAKAAGWGESVETALQAAFSDTSRSDRTDVTVFQIGGNSSAWEQGHVWNLDGLKEKVKHFAVAVEDHPWPFRVLVKPWKAYFPGYRPLNPIDLSGVVMQLQTLSVYEIRLLKIQADVEYIQSNIEKFAGADTDCLEDTKVVAAYGLKIVNKEQLRTLRDHSHPFNLAVKFLIPDSTCLPDKPVREEYLGCYHTKQIKRLSQYWARNDEEGGAFRSCASLAHKHGLRYFGVGGGTSISRTTIGKFVCFALHVDIGRQNLTEPKFGYGVCGSECQDAPTKWCGFASRGGAQKVALYHKELPAVKWQPARVSARATERSARDKARAAEDDERFAEEADFSDGADPHPRRPPSDSEEAPPDLLDQARLGPSDGPRDPAMRAFSDDDAQPVITIHKSSSPATLRRRTFLQLGLLLAL